jgi:hypothetical protein
MTEVGPARKGRRRRSQAGVRDPEAQTIVVARRDRVARLDAEEAEAALAAQGRRLWVVHPSEVDDDLARGDRPPDPSLRTALRSTCGRESCGEGHRGGQRQGSVKVHRGPLLARPGSSGAESLARCRKRFEARRRCAQGSTLTGPGTRRSNATRTWPDGKSARGPSPKRSSAPWTGHHPTSLPPGGEVEAGTTVTLPRLGAPIPIRELIDTLAEERARILGLGGRSAWRWTSRLW